MSSPRAAMSVATRHWIFPALKSARACCRAVWLLLPWMAAAVMPALARSLATLLAPCLVRVNTRAFFTSSSRIRWESSLVLLFLSTKYTDCWMASTGEDTGSTATRTGSWSREFTSSAISGGMVAENSMVCFLRGSHLRIFFTSWMKPMSSIRSASSSTKISSWSSLTKPCWYRSMSRPGVATRMSTPRPRASTWGFWPTPPKMTAHRRGRCLP